MKVIRLVYAVGLFCRLVPLPIIPTLARVQKVSIGWLVQGKGDMDSKETAVLGPQ